MPRGGLGLAWPRVIAALLEASRFYELANKIMSLGTVGYLRRAAARGLRKCEGPLLDAGSGPGQMLVEALRAGAKPSVFVALDPLEEMLRLIGGVDELALERVRGVFERLPLRSGAFECVATSFALRDALDVYRALRELSAVVGPGGRLVILELHRPREPVRRILVELYFNLAPRIAGAIVAGHRGLKLYGALPLTMRLLPPGRLYEAVLRKLGLIASSRLFFASSVAITVGVKPLSRARPAAASGDPDLR
ncbi:MAG: class I SAM-dependent methyltransferase [Fervidicoccaceae archaeon]